MPLKVTDTTDGGPIFITGGEIETLDAQTVRIVVCSKTFAVAALVTLVPGSHQSRLLAFAKQLFKCLHD